MKTILALASLLSVPCSAQQPATHPAGRPAPRLETRAAERNLRISFKLKEQNLESAGNFTVRNGSQSNYIAGGEVPFETEMAKGKAVDYKKTGVIVNCLPRALSEDAFALVCQFELSGPGLPVGTLGARPAQTFQLQSEFTVRKGKTLVLVDEPTRRVEIKLDELPL